MLDFIPKSWLPHMDTAVAVLVVLLIAILFYALVARVIRLSIARNAISRPVGAVIRSVLRWSFGIVAVLIVLQELGVLENLWTALVAVAALVAIGFVAVWSVMSNLLCALIILISRPFRVGDEVGFAGEDVQGTLIDFGTLFTTLRSNDGRLLQIPNNLFFQRTLVRKQGESTITLWEQLNKQGPTE